MRATDLIREQHEEARGLFGEVQRAPVEEQAELGRELAATLRAHLQMEQELLYPRFQEKQGFEELIERSIDDHNRATMAIGEFERAEPGDPDFTASCKKVQQLVFDHMSVEERDLLPKLEGMWTNDLLEQLGDELKRRYDAILDDIQLGIGEELGG